MDVASASAEGTARAGYAARLRAWLPRGGTLPADSWRARHRAILVVLWLHVPLLVAFGVYEGHDRWVSNAYYEGAGLATSLVEGGVIALFALVATWPGLGRRVRSVAASLGLVTCSAVLTQFSGGFIEAHFHFFVMLGVIAMYLDWVPFLLAIGYVVVHHGTVGTFDPSSVYNHPAAIASPWRWAFIHAFFVLGLSVAQIAHWRMTESARARTELVLHSTGEAIVGLARDGKVAFANASAARLLRTDEDAMVGRPFAALARIATEAEAGPLAAPTGTRQPEASGASGAVGAGAGADAGAGGEDQERHGDGVLHRPDGSTLAVEWSRVPVRQEGSGSLAAVLTLKDVSERVRAEAERARQRETLKQLEQLREQDIFKTRFINSAAHELNTPLTPVQIQLRLLRKGGTQGFTPRQREALDVLDRNIHRFGRLVQDLLDSARFQGGRLGMHKERIRVEDVVQEAAQSFQGAAAESGIALRTATEKGLAVDADAQRLSQVVYNLVNNALKFTPQGGEVQIEARRVGHDAVVTVRDSGAGLTPEQIGRLFQPFSQVHEGAPAMKQGTGLGLYLSRGILDLHNGRLWCESEGRGRGSRFSFSLPLADPVLPGAPARRETETDPALAEDAWAGPAA